MLMSWLRAKKAEFKAREARAQAATDAMQSVSKSLSESLSDPWGEPEPDPDEKDWIAIDVSGRGVGLPQRLRGARRKSQQLYYQNPTAKGIIETYVQFIVGEGFTPRGMDDATTKTVLDMARQVDFPEVASEFVRRYFRDGEVFLRVFPAANAVRFIDPQDVVTKDGNEGKAIETARDDVRAITGYKVKMGDDDFVTIPAAEIIHAKHGVDMNVKRGIPLLWVVLQRLRKYDTWLSDLGTLIKARTAIALIRKHEGSSPGQITAFADSLQTGEKTDAKADQNATVRLQRIRPGTILDTQGIDYEFKSPNVDASDLSNYGRQVMLSIASGVQLAEYMVSADASNNNFASLTVAETVPFERFVWFQKNVFVPAFVDMFNRLLFTAGNGGIQPEDKTTEERIIVEPAALPVRQFKDTVEGLSLMFVDGIISRQTYAARMGYNWQQERAEIEQEADASVSQGGEHPEQEPTTGGEEPETPEAPGGKEPA